MSGQIRVSPETLQSRAREYGKAANDIRVILSNLQRCKIPCVRNGKVLRSKALINNSLN